MSTKFCSECGCLLEYSDSFCAECGTPASSDDSTNKAHVFAKICDLSGGDSASIPSTVESLVDANGHNPFVVGPWHVKSNDSVLGPFPLLALLRLPDETEISVGNPALNNWLSLREFKSNYINSIDEMLGTPWMPDTSSAPETVRIASSVDQTALNEVLQKVEKLTGLRRAKQELQESISLIQVTKRRREYGLQSDLGSFHAVFSGNPGTGKTTFARLYAAALKALGVVQKDSVVEVTRSDLVAGYEGQTALKINEVITTALGGVLFIDEAYSLVTNDEDSYGHEALAVLIKAMEDRREELVVVLAGYTKDMDGLLSANPGLRSRILSIVHFDDYSEDELLEISQSIAKSKNYLLETSCVSQLRESLRLARSSSDDRSFGNAREARNVIDRMIRSHALRTSCLAEPTREQLTLLTSEDLKN